MSNPLKIVRLPTEMPASADTARSLWKKQTEIKFCCKQRDVVLLEKSTTEFLSVVQVNLSNRMFTGNEHRPIIQMLSSLNYAVIHRLMIKNWGNQLIITGSSNQRDGQLFMKVHFLRLIVFLHHQRLGIKQVPTCYYGIANYLLPFQGIEEPKILGRFRLRFVKVEEQQRYRHLSSTNYSLGARGGRLVYL